MQKVQIKESQFFSGGMSECKIFDNKKFAEMNYVGRKNLVPKISFKRGSLQNFYCKTRRA